MSRQKTKNPLPRYQDKVLQVAILGISLFGLILSPLFAQEELPISYITASSSALGSSATQAIDHDLSIFWHQDSGSTNYSLQGSNNGKRWTNLLTNLSSIGGLTNPYLKEHNLFGSFRYLRLYIRRPQKGPPTIYELKVFGQPPSSDTTAPTGSIQINSDQAYTNSNSVTLSLSARDNPGGSGLAQMQFSNDGLSWSAPQSYATTQTWSLTSGNGQKIVYVKSLLSQRYQINFHNSLINLWLQ